MTCVFGHQPCMRRQTREAIGCVSSEPGSTQIGTRSRGEAPDPRRVSAILRHFQLRHSARQIIDVA